MPTKLFTITDNKNCTMQFSAIDNKIDWSSLTTNQTLRCRSKISPIITSKNADATAINHFKNLLPEGRNLHQLANFLSLKHTDALNLCSSLGQELTGRFDLTVRGHRKSAIRHCISSVEMGARLDNREQTPMAFWDGQPLLSVAGVQDKLNVSIEDGMFYVGGEQPTSHILKFETDDTRMLVSNELYTMRLARRAGLSVASVDIMRLGDHPALAVKRFDRKRCADGALSRLHIIDACQVLGLAPDYKYERIYGSGRDVRHIREGASLPLLFDIANQASDKHSIALLDWVVFNAIAGNYDAHGKNVSYFFDGKSLALAPFYDILCLEAFGDKWERQFAMAHGDDFDPIPSPFGLAEMALVAGISIETLIFRIEAIISGIRQAYFSQVIFSSLNHKLTTAELSHAKLCEEVILERAEALFNALPDINDSYRLLKGS